MVWSKTLKPVYNVNSLKWNPRKTKDIVTKRKSIVGKAWVLSEGIDSKGESTRENFGLMEMWCYMTCYTTVCNNKISWNCILKIS